MKAKLNENEIDLFELLEYETQSQQPKRLHLSVPYRYADQHEQAWLISKAIAETENFNDKQLLEAAKTIYPYLLFKTNSLTSNNTVKETNFLTDAENARYHFFGSSEEEYFFSIHFDMKYREKYSRYLLVTDAKDQEKYTEELHSRRDPYRRIKYISAELLVGFADIIQGIDRTYKFNRCSFTRCQLKDYLAGLIAGRKSLNYVQYQNIQQKAEFNSKPACSDENITDEPFFEDPLLSEIWKKHVKGENIKEAFNYSGQYADLIKFVQDYLDSMYIIEN